ncbi:MAG: hypothetical protein SGPRY_005581, partial [Prymnesium sp.]
MAGGMAAVSEVGRREMVREVGKEEVETVDLQAEGSAVDVRGEGEDMEEEGMAREGEVAAGYPEAVAMGGGRTEGEGRVGGETVPADWEKEEVASWGAEEVATSVAAKGAAPLELGQEEGAVKAGEDSRVRVVMVKGIAGQGVEVTKAVVNMAAAHLVEAGMGVEGGLASAGEEEAEKEMVMSVEGRQAVGGGGEGSGGAEEDEAEGGARYRG